MMATALFRHGVEAVSPPYALYWQTRTCTDLEKNSKLNRNPGSVLLACFAYV